MDVPQVLVFMPGLFLEAHEVSLDLASVQEEAVEITRSAKILLRKSVCEELVVRDLAVTPLLLLLLGASAPSLGGKSILTRLIVYLRLERTTVTELEHLMQDLSAIRLRGRSEMDDRDEFQASHTYPRD